MTCEAIAESEDESFSEGSIYVLMARCAQSSIDVNMC